MSITPDIQKITVIGSGKMGTDIFNFLRSHDFSLVWLCRSQDETAEAEKVFEKRMRRQLKTGMISEDDFRFRTSSTLITYDLSAASDSELIIESIWEKLPDKVKLFEKLDRIAPQNCIFSSNSSSYTPSQLTPSKKRAEGFVGIHFFFPSQLINLIEYIRTPETSVSVDNAVVQFFESLDRTVLQLEEQHAFILNRIMMHVQSEGVRIVNDRIVSIAQLDSIARRIGFPLGIFECMDHVGIDIMAPSVSNYIKIEQGAKEHHLLLDWLRDLYVKGRFGIKSGKGFYNYPKEKEAEESSVVSEETHDEIAGLLIKAYARAAENAVVSGACNKQELELALADYNSMEKGPFALAEVLI